MRFSSMPTPPARPPSPRWGDGSEGAARQVRRAFVTVNAVPLAIGVALSCSTALSGVRVYGRLTVGVVWGALQLVVFLASVWWYEDRSTRLCASAERSLGPDLPSAGPAGAPATREGW